MRYRRGEGGCVQAKEDIIYPIGYIYWLSGAAGFMSDEREPRWKRYITSLVQRSHLLLQRERLHSSNVRPPSTFYACLPKCVLTTVSSLFEKLSQPSTLHSKFSYSSSSFTLRFFFLAKDVRSILYKLFLFFFSKAFQINEIFLGRRCNNFCKKKNCLCIPRNCESTTNKQKKNIAN